MAPLDITMDKRTGSLNIISVYITQLLLRGIGDMNIISSSLFRNHKDPAKYDLWVNKFSIFGMT